MRITRSPRLLDQVRRALRVRRYSRRTEEAYVGWVRRYVLFHGKRHPRKLGTDAIAEFLTDLAETRRVSASTQSQAASALIFLYEKVLDIRVGHVGGVVRARGQRRLPVVLTRDEVREILRHLKGTKRLIVLLLYGLPFGILSPRTCWRTAMTFGRYRSYWAIGT